MSFKLSKIEQQWFVSIMALYGLILLSFEASIGEILLVLVVFTISWYITSYLIQRNRQDESLQTEMKWFGGILVLLILILLFLGSISAANMVIFTVTYTVVWILRSSLIKYFRSE